MSQFAKLIKLVQKESLLYDLSDTNYKNRRMKTEIWHKIAKKMGNDNGKEWSSKWKNLKDNYIKYQKATKTPSNPTYRKYKKWPWAKQMKFLDDYNNKNTTKSNFLDQSTSQSDSQFIDSFNEENLGGSFDSPEISVHGVLQNKFHSGIGEGTKTKSAFLTDKVLQNYEMKKNRKKSKDDVDYLFSSYKKSFKKLQPPMQTLLKLEMAKLFAQFELQLDTDTNTSTENTIILYLSSVKTQSSTLLKDYYESMNDTLGDDNTDNTIIK